MYVGVCDDEFVANGDELNTPSDDVRLSIVRLTSSLVKCTALLLATANDVSVTVSVTLSAVVLCALVAASAYVVTSYIRDVIRSDDVARLSVTSVDNVVTTGCDDVISTVVTWCVSATVLSTNDVSSSDVSTASVSLYDVTSVDALSWRPIVVLSSDVIVYLAWLVTDDVIYSLVVNWVSVVSTSVSFVADADCDDDENDGVVFSLVFTVLATCASTQYIAIVALLTNVIIIFRGKTDGANKIKSSAYPMLQKTSQGLPKTTNTVDERASRDFPVRYM